MRLSYRRAHVIPFWLLGTAAASVVAAITATMLGGAAPWVWAVGVAAGLLLPGVFWRPWWETGIWVWNGVQRRSAIGLRRYVLMVCYYTLFVPVSLIDTRVNLQPPSPGASKWSARESSLFSLAEFDQVVSDDAGWYGALHACARRAGNAWVIYLVPALFLLHLFRNHDAENVPPGTTYTLY